MALDPRNISFDPEDGFSYADIEEMLIFGHFAIDSYAGSGPNANGTALRPVDGWEAILTTDGGATDIPLFHSAVPTFQASAYRRNGDVVIALRGTDDTNELFDTSIPLGLGILEGSEQAALIPPEFGVVSTESYLQAAFDFYNAVNASYPEASISFVGHSLGGIVGGMLSAATGLPALAIASGPHSEAFERFATRIDIDGDGEPDEFAPDTSALWNIRVAGEVLEALLRLAKEDPAVFELAVSLIPELKALEALVPYASTVWSDAARLGTIVVPELEAGDQFAPSDLIELHSVQLHQLLLYADHALGLDSDYKATPGFLMSFFDNVFADAVSSRYASGQHATQLFSDIVLSLLDGGEDVVTPLLKDIDRWLPNIRGLDFGDMNDWERRFVPSKEGGELQAYGGDHYLSEIVSQLLIEHAAQVLLGGGGFESPLMGDTAAGSTGLRVDIEAIREASGPDAGPSPYGLLRFLNAFGEAYPDAARHFDDWEFDQLVLTGSLSASGSDGVDLVIGGAEASDLRGWEEGALAAEDGDDLLLGNDGDDVLQGGGGADALFGGDGFDALVGGDGDDFLDGGENPVGQGDILIGGRGDDIYHVDSGLDLVDEGIVFAGDADGLDEIISTAGFFWDVHSAGDIMRIAERAGGATTVIGSVFPNLLVGNSQDNVLFGRGGADTYIAGDGIDLISLSTLGVTDGNAYAGVDGPNTVVVGPRATGEHSYDIVFEFETGKDKLDLSDYGLTSVNDVLARGVDDGFGNCYFILGDGLDYLYMVGLELDDVTAGDFIV